MLDKGVIGGFDGLFVFVLIVEKVKEEQLMVVNNIFVIFQVVGRFMVRYFICGCICVGIWVSVYLCVIGYFVENDLFDLMSCNVIEEFIWVKNVLCVQNVENVLCEVIIC